MALALVTPWRTQPYRTVGVNWSNPLSYGLVFARLGGSQTSVWPGNNVTCTGTRIRGSQFGLADGFGSTLGAGTTDVINSGFNGHPISRTLFVQCYKFGNGGNNLPRLLDNSSDILYAQSSNTRIAFQANFSTTAGEWITSTNIVPNGIQATFAVTYNAASTVNNPIIYLNGRSIAITEFSAPAGTWVAGTANWNIGNNATGIRNWDGLIAETYIWNRILTPAEIFSIHSNPYQIFRGAETLSVPTYYPILSNLQATRGNTSASLRTNITY